MIGYKYPNFSNADNLHFQLYSKDFIFEMSGFSQTISFFLVICDSIREIRHTWDSLLHDDGVVQWSVCCNRGGGGDIFRRDKRNELETVA